MKLVQNPVTNDQENIARFIILRSLGWSFNRIVAEFDISKPTLIKWSRQRQFELNNFRFTETEALAERVFVVRQKCWERLSRQLKQLEGECEKRDIKKIPASRLHSIVAALRVEINQEIGGTRSAETAKKIPGDEYVCDTEKWEG